MAETVKTLSKKLKDYSDKLAAKKAEYAAAKTRAENLGEEVAQINDEYVRLDVELHAAVRREAGIK